jgi:CheY-like chemotaxis protein
MKKYLLIDDEEIFNFIQSEVIHNFISESETITYSSASEAIEYLKVCFKKAEKCPDFIFLDVRMPEMDGFAFLEKLSEFDPRFFNCTQIFMLSSTIDERDKQRAFSYPFVKDFLEKPLSEEILNQINNTSIS